MCQSVNFKQIIIDHVIDQSVWEMMQPVLAETRLYFPPAIWRFQHPLNRCIDLGKKSCAQTGPARFVLLGSGFELFKR